MAPPTRERDKESVFTALTGDEKEMNDLLGRVRAQAFRHAMVRTGDQDESDDIAQEAMVRVFRSLDGFRFRSKLATWVHRVAEEESPLGFCSRNFERKRLICVERFAPKAGSRDDLLLRGRLCMGASST